MFQTFHPAVGVVLLFAPGDGGRCSVAAFYEKVEPAEDEKKPNHLVIAMSSDRGLCGAVHSNIFRAIRAAMNVMPPNTNVRMVAVGEKAKVLLRK